MNNKHTPVSGRVFVVTALWVLALFSAIQSADHAQLTIYYPTTTGTGAFYAGDNSVQRRMMFGNAGQLSDGTSYYSLYRASSGGDIKLVVTTNRGTNWNVVEIDNGGDRYVITAWPVDTMLHAFLGHWSASTNTNFLDGYIKGTNWYYDSVDASTDSGGDGTYYGGFTVVNPDTIALTMRPYNTSTNFDALLRRTGAITTPTSGNVFTRVDKLADGITYALGFRKPWKNGVLSQSGAAQDIYFAHYKDGYDTLTLSSGLPAYGTMLATHQISIVPITGKLNTDYGICAVVQNDGRLVAKRFSITGTVPSMVWAWGGTSDDSCQIYDGPDWDILNEYYTSCVCLVVLMDDDGNATDTLYTFYKQFPNAGDQTVNQIWGCKLVNGGGGTGALTAGTPFLVLDSLTATNPTKTVAWLNMSPVAYQLSGIDSIDFWMGWQINYGNPDSGREMRLTLPSLKTAAAGGPYPARRRHEILKSCDVPTDTIEQRGNFIDLSADFARLDLSRRDEE